MMLHKEVDLRRERLWPKWKEKAWRRAGQLFRERLCGRGMHLLPPSTWVEFTESVCNIQRWQHKEFNDQWRKQGGKISLLNLHHKARKIIRLFTDFIDPIGFAFHNFLVSVNAFCSLESITWRKCKNLLLRSRIVAKMLVVKSESSCSLTLVPGPARLFSQEYPG